MTPTHRFPLCLSRVLAHEGGLVDDPRDPGGITHHGISLRFLRTVWPDATAATVRDLTEAQAADLYRDHFWEAVKAKGLWPGLDYLAFDAAVNQGRGTAARLMQRALGVTADGVVGPITCMAAQIVQKNGDAAMEALLMDFAARRAKRYAAHPGVQTFGRGWYHRLLEVYEDATTDAFVATLPPPRAGG